MPRRTEMKDDGQDEGRQTEERLQKLLQGAFSGPPTPLKAIPPKAGVMRAPRAEQKGSFPKRAARSRSPLS